MKKKLLFAATTATAAATAYSYQADAAEHKVSAGESLWSIANQYNISVAQLKSLNNLSSNLIFPNQSLKISGSASNTRPVVVQSNNRPASQSGSTYKVVAGDSLSLIANRYNTSVNEIMRLNNLNGYLIFPGQRLKVSGTTVSAPSRVTTVPNSGNRSTSVHTVQSGEYLSLIANRYGITVAQLKSWNGLTSDIIYPNQRLTVKAGTTQTTTQVQTNVSRSPVTTVVTNNVSPVFYHSNLYDLGQCTWHVFNKRAAIGKGISTYWWHARNWANGAIKDGYTVNRTPAYGAIAQTSDGYYGHVAFVERVNADGTVLVSEMNYATAPGVIGYRTLNQWQLSRYVFIH
ncbi:LysM peptidoglycan-binding domain-containing protein [Macrococcus armenti]|uniref:LysM peptidoglycan-binding domain-containing protein n=1 Tax=Macrococcus armenti TaxID=2875764 RepID=UPI001CCEDAFD|nr:LysM peptidoglycan-binding domain-containing protein [Macrococcus armenti]UBH08451.1 LysM peptidoglycan-binding domain-containing protein [Macrococcus armenti]UBH10737.1 LysM peptidoglycan-binding domain-containing protein [Macrococcus armenti]UBH15219.1 LysM peptidoglycan-binding domain-containing protein [Macrococcus armenti]UBH17578.1 LysM peptidoglycan-binding domain-containing protein [Macrococcus armenti]UBH19844.1 LysM peptidoglycan-binding domain-containing protein [Macrococcus arme